MAVRRTGDWDLARRLVVGGAARLRNALRAGVRQEAQLLRKGIVEGLTNQAPGGAPLAPLAKTTLAARALKKFGGTKALLRRGELRNSVTTVSEDLEAFVGILRKARGRGGKPLANVAEINEFGYGPIVIPITPKMRRFLFLLLRRAGVAPSGGGGQRGAVVIRIPARPFLRPAYEAFKRGAKQRFLRRVAQLVGIGV
jgi:hypothetical protein